MQQHHKAQSTFDYLILTTVILVVIVPLLFFSTNRIDQSRVAELQDALEALKEGVTQVNNLGFGTSSVVVIRVPKGVTEQRVGTKQSTSNPAWCNRNMLCYRVAGSDLYVKVPADVAGILPLNEGLHHVQLFNNGTHVLLYQCGNNRREAFEQCDGTDNSACSLSGDPGQCSLPNEANSCKCRCFNNNDCSGSTGLCDTDPLNPTYGVCVPCSQDAQCAANGKVCLSGQCIDPTHQCRNNGDCGYILGASSGAQVCNKAVWRCEPCDVPPLNPPTKDCNPGHSCIVPGGSSSYCGIIGTPNDPPLVNAGSDRQTALPLNYISLNGTVTDDGLLLTTPTILWTKFSGSGTVTFGNANAVDTTATFTQPGTYILQLSAYDGQYTILDNLQVSVLCVHNSQCNYPVNVCVGGNCQPCTLGTQCTLPHDLCSSGTCTTGGNPLCSFNSQCPAFPSQVCNTQTRSCEPCTSPPSRLFKSCGPGWACQLSTGRCQPFSGTPICGNDLLELGEECERTPDCPPLAGHTATCDANNCLCAYSPIARSRDIF